MDAMILAAGLGTRLQPLTEETPKALIEVGGVPLLERVARRLAAAGADRLIVNVHPQADRVARFCEDLAARLGVEVLVSREDVGERPLETGGGLLHAASLFRREAPFLLHNVDVVSEVDLAALHATHPPDALATLAVHERETSRFLLFDRAGLFGWENAVRGLSRTVRNPGAEFQRIAFAGIHTIAPAVFEHLEAAGYGADEPFSILEAYLRLAAEGHRVLPHDVTGAFWIEVGTPARRARAEEILAARDGPPI